MAIGSRDVTGSVLVHAPWHRKYIGRAFNRLVRLLTGLPFKDTQCGFKLMRTEVARELLGEQTVSGYAFDVELLMRATSMPGTSLNKSGIVLKPDRAMSS